MSDPKPVIFETIITPPVSYQTEVRPPVVFESVVQLGVQGRRGAPGTDAAVTAENISSALGFAPTDPATLSKHLFQGFSVTPFDTSIPTFSGGVLTLFTLKSGGASGAITNTVAYNYSGGLLTSKVLKDPSGATLNTITFSYSGATLTSKVLT